MEENNNMEESSTLGILAIVFSVLGGWIGLVLSIVGLVTYKEESNKKLCKIGLGIFAAEFVLGIILIIVFVIVGASTIQPYM